MGGVESKGGVARELKISDFMAMFNVNKGGGFKTANKKTHGQIVLRNGKLVNVNRYDPLGLYNKAGENCAKTADNYRVRVMLVNALRAGGADEAMIENAKSTLGLTKQGVSEEAVALPLSRRAVKLVLQGYFTSMNKRTANLNQQEYDDYVVYGTAEELAVKVHPEAKEGPIDWRDEQPVAEAKAEVAEKASEAPEIEQPVAEAKAEVAEKASEAPRNTAECIKEDMGKMQEKFALLRENCAKLSGYSEVFGDLKNESAVRCLERRLSTEEDDQHRLVLTSVKASCKKIQEAIARLEQATNKTIRALLASDQVDVARKRLDQAEKLSGMLQQLFATVTPSVETSFQDVKKAFSKHIGDIDVKGEVKGPAKEKINHALKTMEGDVSTLEIGTERFDHLVRAFENVTGENAYTELAQEFMQSQTFKDFVDGKDFKAMGIDVWKNFDNIVKRDKERVGGFDNRFDAACSDTLLASKSVGLNISSLSGALEVKESTAIAEGLICGEKAQDAILEQRKVLRMLHMEFLMKKGCPLSENNSSANIKAQALIKMAGMRGIDAYYYDNFLEAVKKNLDRFDAIGPCDDADEFKAKVQAVLDAINLSIKTVDCSECNVLSSNTTVENVDFDVVPPQCNAARRFAADLASSEHLEYCGLANPSAEAFRHVLRDNEEFARKLLKEAVEHIKEKNDDDYYGNILNDDSDELINACESAKGLDSVTRQMLQAYLKVMIGLAQNWFSEDEYTHAAKWMLRNGNLEAVLRTFDIAVSWENGRMEKRQALELSLATEAFAAVVKKSVDRIQEEFNRSLDEFFPAGDGGKFDPTADSLDKIIASGPDRDVEFVKNALKCYFKKISALDKSRLLATLIRNDGTAMEGDEQTAAILKSTGPIMLKMLQGLDISRLGKGMGKILADLKDHLYDIPENQVKAYLGELIDESRGRITGIEVVKSLGAASVGQTLLCNVTHDDGGVETCAIKILRPGARFRALREREVLDEVAKEMGEDMRATFAGKMDSIMREFDLVHEAENIEKGRTVYASSVTNHENVDSVELTEDVKPTDHVMFMKAVKGNTFKQTLEGIAKEVDGTTDSQRLMELREQVVRNHRALEALAKLWVKKAIFAEKGGIYHGDLHSGNIMIDDGGKATMIDFGNVTELNDDEAKALLHLIAGAASGISTAFNGVVYAIKTLLPKESSEKFAKRIGEEAGKKLKGELSTTLMDRINGIIRLGTGQDVGLRVTAVLKLLKAEGIEVPPAIHNFNESQIRLNEVLNLPMKTLESIDKKLKREPMSGELLSLVDCVGEVVKENVDFTIERVGRVSGFSFAGGFKENGLITEEQYQDILYETMNMPEGVREAIREGRAAQNAPQRGEAAP